MSRARSEHGVAIVIAIFTLMLISVVATALILMAGTESAIKGNYKSAMHAFYDAKAGLEEGRGRLFWPNPNVPNPVANCVLAAPGTIIPPTRVCYIVNPSTHEVVNPLDLSAGNPYADLEYQQEWGIAVNDPTLQVQQPFITSTSVIPKAGVGGTDIAGPLYKWVRITPRTEASAKLDVDGNHTPNTLDKQNPLFYDGMQQLVSAGGKPVPNAAQVFTVTALAMTPYGSRRMVQYTVAPSAFASSLATFPSALILDGTGVQFKGYFSGNQAPANGAFQINGNDGAPSVTSPGIPAIGYTNSSDYTNTNSGLSTAAASKNYLSPQNVSNVGLLTLPPMLQTPSGLDRLVQSITQNADLVLNPPSGTAADQTSLTSMSAANPMVVVVNGDFHLSHASGTGFTGYGLLLVTGTLRYDPDVSWYGIILVIGKGVFDGSQSGIGGQINGTVLIANTRDNSGNLLSSLGPASFNQTAGNGIQYNSQLVTSTEALMPYQVLSFREIDQTIP
jgi:hypothetical protein